MRLNKKQEKISHQILNYLRRNHDAGDTLKGIMDWWLEIDKIESSIDDIELVLTYLRKKGIIKQNVRTGVYKINI